MATTLRVTDLSVRSLGSGRSGPATPSENRRCTRINVKAIGRGTAKYKGTQMRVKKLTEMIEAKVMEAKEACEGDRRSSDECKVAWDEVEEISQAKADLRLKLNKNQDPLESFCQQNPYDDECDVYGL